MIDWVKAVIPWEHEKPLSDGHVVSIDRDGEIEWLTNKRLAVRGSYESTLHIQSDFSSRSLKTANTPTLLLTAIQLNSFKDTTFGGLMI